MTEPGVITVIIPAFNEAQRIGATVMAAATVPGVERVVVVDDGSVDDTALHAHSAGAVVLSLTPNQGKAAAMQRGGQHAIDGMSSNVEQVLVFVDADLEKTASEVSLLAAPVLEGLADMCIATLPRQSSAGGGHGFVVRLARDGIIEATGWRAEQPLSGQRALTPAAFSAALPLAHGFGVEVGLTIDLLNRGFRVSEVEVPFHHRVTGKDWSAHKHRARQFWAVWRALRARGVGPVVPIPRKSG